MTTQGVNSQFFTLVPGTNNGEASIFPNISFDREKRENSGYRIGDDLKYAVTVKVEDNGKKKLASTCFFLVTIADENDYAPKFDLALGEHDYSTAIRMDHPAQSRVIRTFAVDEDAGTNALVTYSVKTSPQCNNQDCMGIEANSGWIYIRQTLPNEVSPSSVKTSN